MSSASNSTSLMNLIPNDFVMAFPRMMARAGSFAFVTVPERLDSIIGLRGGVSMIAEATGNGSMKMISTAFSSDSSLGAALPSAAGAAATEAPRLSSLSFHQVRNFGGIFAYMTSKWALACFTLAIILNRTQIYASARRHITFSWPIRLAIRIMPIIMFLSHTLGLLQAMRCQTSPNYSSLRYGKAHKQLDMDFSGDGGIIYWISSMLLFWENDASSCLAVDMIPSRSEVWDRSGSLSLLWPFFQSLCLGQFVETLSCAVQGRQLMTETGMSIFEHSLAFAESEAMISSQLGLSLWSAHKASKATSTSSQPDPVGKLFTRSEILDKMNTPPEVLLMVLISSLNNLSSQILGVLNMQARYRLINTGIWGMCFMSAFGWGFFSLRPESGPESIILRFPTVCIVGFIPHLLILVGILLCATIYSLALLLCFFSPPNDEPPPRTLAERFRKARENMQANAQLSSIRLDMTEDFYTALLKIGFTALTVASEAVFLNEGLPINVGTSTWLEEERLKELEAFGPSHDPVEGVSVHFTKPAAADQHSRERWKSGYDRVLSFTADKFGSGIANTRQRGDGVGHMQRGGRYLMAAKFFRGIFWLFVSWNKMVTNKLMDKARISWRPQWLRLPKAKEGLQVDNEEGQQIRQQNTMDFWVLSDKGVLLLPENDNVDVEQEMKRRLKTENERWGEEEELTLDSKVYNWWASGGWFGEKDDSGSYQGSAQDDDTTSMVSMSTNASEGSHGAVDDDFIDVDSDAGSGASTPTQRYPVPRSLSPSDPNVLDALDPSKNYSQLSPHHLATLLDPKTLQQRSEARMLAHHLTSTGITTRSQYRHAQSFANAKLLTSTRYRPANSSIPATGPLCPEDEAYLLEQLILTRRTQPASSINQGAGTWRDGAVGMGAGGPQCVVCQSAPRTVLAWPCRCLSLCEDCRVSLAMNNFGTCVCCRQTVVGFSRLFVP
ncbi:MAG: hypothetical protein Q9161_001444 [Pseudevernia consocians]